MSKFENVITWLDSYREVAFDLLRIYLGIGLFIRGILFLLFPSTFAIILSPSTAWLASAPVYYAVTFIHVIGGALMAVGLLTRLAALAQIPILLGAVFFVHLQGGLFTADQSFEFAALVLFLLVLIFLYGSGRWSVDHYVAWEQAQPEADYAAQLRQERARRPEREPMASPAGTSSGGAVVAEPAVAEPPRKPTRAEPAPLTCPLLNDCPVVASEHPRDHPWVELTRRYSTLGGVYFVLGITGPPKEIVFRCKRCRQVIQKSQSREDLDYYKYR